MKIVADENIPFARELFSEFGELTLLPGRHMRVEDVVDADALLVRSVTPVNEALLKQSKVKFVGTCTIGVDHLDIAYLQENEIRYASAPGCNANAVAQYVLSALAKQQKLDSSKNVVVVGGGNVGSRVYKQLKALGMSCVCVDPFIQSKDDMSFAQFDAIYDADIICVHTPFTVSGDFPTQHMFNQEVISKLKPGALLLNAGRGGVVDSQALLNQLQLGQRLTVVLDVWENEPGINAQLLQKVDIGTPHIAGYSFEGRVTGSLMIFRALCQFLQDDEANIEKRIEVLRQRAFGEAQSLAYSTLSESILASYNISKDHQDLIKAISGLPSSFDYLRKHYHQRREYSHYKLQHVSSTDKSTLLKLGFLQEPT